MQLARGGRSMRTERVYPVLLVRDGVVSEGMIPPKREAPEHESAPDTLNGAVKMPRYSCLDIVKPHFQHCHYVKHVAEADKSNNGLGASAATETGEG